jgi:hypothetical protein
VNWRTTGDNWRRRLSLKVRSFRQSPVPPVPLGTADWSGGDGPGVWIIGAGIEVSRSRDRGLKTFGRWRGLGGRCRGHGFAGSLGSVSATWPRSRIHGLHPARLALVWGHLPMIKQAAASAKAKVIGPALGPMATGEAINARFTSLSWHMPPVCLSADEKGRAWPSATAGRVGRQHPYVGPARQCSRRATPIDAARRATPTRAGQKSVVDRLAATSRAHHFRPLSGSKKEKFPENIPEKPSAVANSVEINCGPLLRMRRHVCLPR